MTPQPTVRALPPDFCCSGNCPLREKQHSAVKALPSCLDGVAGAISGQAKVSLVSEKIITSQLTVKAWPS